MLSPHGRQSGLAALAVLAGLLVACSHLDRAARPEAPVSDSFPIAEERVFAFPPTAPSWVYAGAHRSEKGELRFTGVSQRFKTEQEARKDALRDAREEISDYLRTDVTQELRKVRVAAGTSSDILDPATVQEEIAKLLSANILLGTAGNEFYIEQWIRRRPAGEESFWKAYVCVSFPEKRNEELRDTILRGAAQRRLDRVDRLLETTAKTMTDKARLEAFRERFRTARASFEAGRFVDGIAQAQALLDRLTGSVPRPAPAIRSGPRVAGPGAAARHTPATRPARRTVLAAPGATGESIGVRLMAESRYYDPTSAAPFHLLLDLEAPRMAPEGRNPIMLGLVLDTSASMKEKGKLDNLKEAARGLVRQLADEDLLAVVTFNYRSQVLIPLCSARSKTFVGARLDDLAAVGRTNLSAGLLDGWSQLAGKNGSGHVRRLVLVSDGLANEGVTDPDRLREIVGRYRAAGVTTSTVGLGAKFDEKLLIALADAGGGSYYYVASPDGIDDVLYGELGALRGVVAQNVRVAVEPPPGWRIASVSTYDPAYDPGGGASFTIGDVAVGDRQRILLAAERSPATGGGKAKFRVRVSYYDVGRKLTAASRTAEAVALRGDGPGARARGENHDVRVQVELANGINDIRCALECLEDGDLPGAWKLLEDTRARMAGQARDYDSSELTHEVAVLDDFLGQSKPLSGKYGGVAKLDTLRKVLASYWYSAARHKACPHCLRMQRMKAGKAGMGHKH